MRLLLLGALISLSAAASVPGLPSCAGGCVGTSFGSCGTLDVKCICSDSSLIANLACCVSTACDAADQEATIQFADSLCAGEGVTNLPSAATCASTSSGSATASSSTSTRVTPVPVDASSSLSSQLSSAASAASSASTSSAAAASSASASATSASSSVASASASAASTKASATSNAGIKNEAAGLGLGALLAGGLALL